MNELIQALENENRTILTKNPKLAMEFDWSSDAYRLQYNEEMISKLKKLDIYIVSQQRELLSFVEAIREIADMELYHWSNQEVAEYCLKKLNCS